MAKNDTQTQIRSKQKEYDAIIEEAADHRGRERELRKKYDELLKAELATHGVSVESLKTRKIEIVQELLDLKNQRVGEIVADVSLGNILKSEGITELVTLGYTPAAADIELIRATGVTVRPEAPLPADYGDDSVKEILDPSSQTTPDSRQEVINENRSPEGLKKVAVLKAAEEQRIAADTKSKEEADAAAKRAAAEAAGTNGNSTNEETALSDGTGADGGESTPPVTAGKYNNVSNVDLQAHVDANSERLLTKFKPEDLSDRKSTIAALVEMQIAPPAKK